MTAMYPHRKLWFQHTIAPGAHVGATTGAWVDRKYMAAPNVVFEILVTAQAAALTFEFDTADDDGAGSPDAATIRQLGNCAICDGVTDFSDGQVVIDLTAEPYATDGFALIVIGLCCPSRYVRARTVGAVDGTYFVQELGLARNLARA